MALFLSYLLTISELAEKNASIKVHDGKAPYLHAFPRIFLLFFLGEISNELSGLLLFQSAKNIWLKKLEVLTLAVHKLSQKWKKNIHFFPSSSVSAHFKPENGPPPPTLGCDVGMGV